MPHIGIIFVTYDKIIGLEYCRDGKNILNSHNYNF